jgi:hypothetical protein
MSYILTPGVLYKHKDLPRFFTISEDFNKVFLSEDALNTRFNNFSYRVDSIDEDCIKASSINTLHLQGVELVLFFKNYIPVPARIETFSDYASCIHGRFEFETMHCPIQDTTIEMLMELSQLTGLSVAEHADEIHFFVKELISSLEDDAVTETIDNRSDGGC